MVIILFRCVSLYYYYFFSSVSLFLPILFPILYLHLFVEVIFMTNHRITNEAIIRADGTLHGLFVFVRETEMGIRLSAFTGRTPTHSHAISRSLACLAGITRNAHGSQFEFRSVEG